MVSGGFRFDDIHGSDCLLGVPHILINLGSHFCLFLTNLHVTGLSSWWISSKIQFCLVCVWTIWIDVKLLPCFCRGAVNLIPSTAQRRRWFEIVRLWYRDWSSRRTCNFQFSVCRHWPPAKPRTGMSLFQLFSNQTTVRFSQSDWAASEQVNPSSKDVESFPSHSFSPLIIQTVPVRFTAVFFARMMHSESVYNSIRYFWASVCVCQCVWQCGSAHWVFARRQQLI